MDLRLPYYMMYPIPYAFDEDKIQKRDREYLQSMYPATAKKIFPYIQEECDRQEYEGSMIYDEYPDKLQLCLMCRRAYEQVMKQEKWEKETYTPEQIREIVEILMYQELMERRGKEDQSHTLPTSYITEMMKRSSRTSKVSELLSITSRRSYLNIVIMRQSGRYRSG